MIKRKKIKIIIGLFLLLMATLIIYVFSFDDIEPVCEPTADRDVFLLNHVLTDHLQSDVYSHSKKLKFKGSYFTRVYLKKQILKIPDPIFNDEYDYKPTGCDNIDNMDIYCIVNYSKTENGEIEISYNFISD